MKRLCIFLLLVVAISTLSHNVFAQEGEFYGSFGLAYGFDIEELGLQFAGNYSLNQDMRVGLDFTYWLIDNKYLDVYEFNGNFHYLFSRTENYNLYGIGTLGLHISKVDFMGIKSSDSELALGFGGGIEYSVNPVLLYFEPRIFLTGYDQLCLNFGVRYRFK